jgi:hypothetical protein
VKPGPFFGLTFALVQRTPMLLAYEVTKEDGELAAYDSVFIDHATLEADARAWRDRGIHRLVTTKTPTLDDVRRVYQGVGLIDPSHAGVMRGRVSIMPELSTSWGVYVGLDGEYARLIVDVPNVKHEARAIVILELERNR